MDATFIAEFCNIISNTGFPIAMCIILVKYVQKNDDKRENDSKEIREALNNNTAVIQRLIDRIEFFTSKGSE